MVKIKIKPIQLADAGKNQQTVEPTSGKPITLTPQERRNFKLVAPGIKDQVSPKEHADPNTPLSLIHI